MLQLQIAVILLMIAGIHFSLWRLSKQIRLLHTDDFQVPTLLCLPKLMPFMLLPHLFCG